MKYCYRSQYISICLFPSCDKFERYFTQPSDSDNKYFEMTHMPHITVLYAPLADGKTVQQVEEKLKYYSEKISIKSSISFEELYVSAFNTINLKVNNDEELVNLHNYLVELLGEYLHPNYLHAFKSDKFHDDLLPLLHTSNIGKKYSPHLTLGKIFNKSSKIRDHLKQSLTPKDFTSEVFASELYLNSAPENNLIRQYKII